MSNNDNTTFVKLPVTTAVEVHDRQRQTQHGELTCNAYGSGRNPFSLADILRLELANFLSP